MPVRPSRRCCNQTVCVPQFGKYVSLGRRPTLDPYVSYSFWEFTQQSSDCHYVNLSGIKVGSCTMQEYSVRVVASRKRVQKADLNQSFP